MTVVYIFQADVYCSACGQELPTSNWADTDKGALSIPLAMCEADTPHACGGCGIWLENPLTAEGECYVKKLIQNSSSEKVEELKEIYGYLFE